MKIETKRRPFLQSVFRGVVCLGEGFANLASVFNCGTNFVVEPYRYEQVFGTDADRLASDWRAVGGDLRSVMGSEQRRK